MARHSLLGYAEDVLVHGNADDEVSLHRGHLGHTQPLRGFLGVPSQSGGGDRLGRGKSSATPMTRRDRATRSGCQSVQPFLLW